MHVGDEEIEPTVAVEIEDLDAHRAPGRLREVLPGCVPKPLPSLVEPEVILPLHVEDIEIRPTVLVHVDNRGITAPAQIHEPDLAGHVLEAVPAQVAVQDAGFRAVGVRVAMEGVRQAHEVTARALRVAGVDTDIGHEQIEQAVAIVVEEDRSGGVTHVSHSRLRGDVPKLPAAQVLEQPVAVSHRRDEQVGVAVVVDVGERARDRDGVFHAQPRLVSDVLEPAATQVPPQLVAAELRDEVQVGQPVAVHVGGAESRPVIVMVVLVGLARVVDDSVCERDAARLPPVREPEVVQHLRLGSQRRLLGSALEQPGWRRRCGAVSAVGPARDEHAAGRDEQPAAPREQVQHKS